MSDNIKVAIRVRPLIKREQEQRCESYWNVNQNSVCGKHSSTPYVFDRVFDVKSSTDEVYIDIAAPLVEGAMQGFNSTIFAYGQTASGKTFTMMGNAENPGIIPQAVEEIYTTIENSYNREFLIRVSYLEIYNEQVVDLLGDPKKFLDVREDKVGHVFVSNLSEEVVTSAAQIIGLMKKGEMGRHFGSTNMNERSSRSHTIFRVIIESKERSESMDGVVNVSHMNLVDLAGSEKAKQTGATGQRLAEGGFINKSLFTLGQVISQLSEGSNFVNFRDSKLTRILQNALGGNSRTAIICNITHASQDETQSTLRFATSAKRIKNKPVLNECLSDEALLKRYKSQITSLKAELEQIRKLEVVNIHEENQELQKRLAEKERHLSKLICVSSQALTTAPVSKSLKKRRETWCPGKALLSVVPSGVANQLDLARPSSGNLCPKGGFLTPTPKISNPDMSRIRSPRSRSLTSRHMDTMDEESSGDESSISKRNFLSDLRGNTDLEITGMFAIDVEIQTDEDPLHQDMRETVSLMEKLVEDKVKYQDKIAQLELALEEAHQRCEEKEFELQELEDFARWEKQFKDESILEKQQFVHSPVGKKLMLSPGGAKLMASPGGPRLMASPGGPRLMASPSGPGRLDLMKQIEYLTKTMQDSQAITLETRQQLAAAKDEKVTLQQSLEEMKNHLERLENEKQDFDTYMSLERTKHQQRESELKDQLEEAYLQISQQHSQGGNTCDEEGVPLSMESSQLATSRMGNSFTDTVEPQESCSSSSQEVAALHVKLQELEEKLKSVEAEKIQLEEDRKECVSEAIDVQNELMDLQSQLHDQNEKTKEYETMLIEARERLLVAENAVPKAPCSETDSGVATESSPEQSEEMARLEAEVTAAAQQVSSLQTEVSSAEEQNLRLEAEASLAKEEAEKALATLAIKEEKLEALRVQHSQQLQELEDRLDDARRTSQTQTSDLEDRLEEEQRRKQDAESETRHLQEVVCTLQETLEQVESQLSETVAQQEKHAAEINAKNIYVVEQQLKVEKKAHDELREKHEILASQTNQNRDRLLCEENRDLDQKRRIEESEKMNREIINNFSQTNKENQALIEDLNNQVYELRCALQKAKGESELASHNMKKSEEACEALKLEIKTLEDLQMRHEAANIRQNMDPDKMLDRIKKLSVSLDLTNQRYSKLESRNKELEGAAKKTEDLKFEHTNLQRQLRDLQHTFKQKEEELGSLRQRYSASFSEIAQLKLNSDTLQQKLDAANSMKEAAQKGQKCIKEEQETLSRMKDDLENELKQMAAECCSWKEKAEQANAENETAQKGQKCLEEEQEKFSKMKGDLENVLKQMTAECSSWKEKAEQANTEKEAVLMGQKCVEEEQEKLSKIKSDLENELKQMTAECDSWKEKVEKANTEKEAVLMGQKCVEEEQEKLCKIKSDLENELKQMTAECDSWKEKVEKANTEKEAVLMGQKCVEEEQEKLSKIKSDLENELKQMTAECDSWKEKVEKFTVEATDSQQQNTQVKMQLESLEEHNKQLEADLSLLAAETAEWARKADEAENLLAEMKEQVEKSSLQYSEEMLGLEVRQQEALDQAKAEADAERESLIEAHRLELAAIQASLECSAESSSQVQDLESRIKELEKEKNNIENAKLYLEEELEAIRPCLAELQGEMEVKGNELAEAYSQEDFLKGTISERNKQVEQAQTELQELHTRLENLQATSTEQMSHQLEEVKAQLEKEQQEHTQKITEMEQNHAKRISEMERHCDSAEDDWHAEQEAHGISLQKIKELEKKLMELKTGATSTEQMSNQLEEVKAQLEKEQQEHTQKITEMEQNHAKRISEMERHCDSAEDDWHAEQEAHGISLQKIKELEKKLKELKTGANSTVEMSDRADELEEVKAQLKKERQEHTQKITEMEQNHAKRISEMEGHCDSAEDDWHAEQRAHGISLQKIAELEKKLKELKTGANSTVEMSDRADELEEVKAQLKKERQEHTQKITEMEQNHAKRISEMEGHCDSAEDDWHAEQRAHGISLQKIKELEKKLKELKTGANSTVEMSDRADELEEVKAQLKKERQEHTQKITEMEQNHAKRISEMEGHCDSAEDDWHAEQRAHGISLQKIEELEKKLKELKTGDSTAIDLGHRHHKKFGSHRDMIQSNGKENSLESHQSLKEELAKAELKINALEFEMFTAVDPYKKRVKSLEQDNNMMRDKLMEMKNEIRKLKNNQPDDSIMCVRPQQVAVGPPEGTASKYMLQAKNEFLDRENKQLKEEVEAQKKSLSTKRLIQLDLEDQVNQAQQKINQFKHYYKKHLNDQEKGVLKDLANSPMKSCVGARSRYDEPDNLGQSGVSRNWLPGSLFKDNKETDTPGDCKPQ